MAVFLVGLHRIHKGVDHAHWDLFFFALDQDRAGQNIPGKAVLFPRRVAQRHRADQGRDRLLDHRFGVRRILQVFPQDLRIQRSVQIVAGRIVVRVSDDGRTHFLHGRAGEQIIHRRKIVGFQIHLVRRNGMCHLHGGLHIPERIGGDHAAKECHVQGDRSDLCSLDCLL